ncbi:MAG TPA: 4Fe-4S binding protein, partial [Candidatus Angelobacter sp.]|nr:4Fe-4S binding protein [Candidatus Angelobacter sp.]
MNLTRRHFLILLPAAALAYEHMLAGTPEAAPNYNTADHWWGMLVDIEKCIGCGSCVRACQKENNVPDGYYRTWIERYRITETMGVETLQVDSPDGGKNGFPPS